ncbi:hypothetical protein B0H10DRAFT_1960301 [Mycena sp. CBHHK59/15]|nr:hypothetical protein B0H10DRAFT_1960301 [Mycena sp. CBHHK59/15]
MSGRKKTRDSGQSHTRRHRVASSRLLDGTNGEAPSAAHLALVEDSQARLKSTGTITTLIKQIEDLSSLLPASIAEGAEEDEIHRVITSIPCDDAGCPAQCRDEDGRLHLIRRGDLGMMLVVHYLRDIKWAAPEMDVGIARIKLERVVKELEILSKNGRSLV